MIQTLVRKCPHCDNILQITIEGNEITTIIGGRVKKIYHSKSARAGDGKNWFSRKILVSSVKQVRCLGDLNSKHPGQFDRGAICARTLRVSAFKEIVL